MLKRELNNLNLIPKILTITVYKIAVIKVLLFRHPLTDHQNSKVLIADL